MKKNQKRSVQKKNDKVSKDLRGEDQETIVNDAAHIPDRDQMFGRDNLRFPSEESLKQFEDWEGDQEEAIEGDRDAESDAVDELRGAEEITRIEGGNQSIADTPQGVGSNNPFPASKRFDDELRELSREDLLSRAEVLGIAGRENMTRIELIEAIRSAQGAA